MLYKTLITLAATACLISTASAYELDVYSLQTNGDPDADTDWFDLSFDMVTGGVSFTLANLTATGNGTKISDIYIGNSCGDSGSEGFCSIFATNDYDLNYNGGAMNYSIDFSPTGGSQIKDWGVAVKEDAQGGSDASTINAGESLTTTFYFSGNNVFDEDDIVQAFADSTLGMAFHVQAIEGGYSEWYGSSTNISVPDPATLGLLGIGFAGLISARRRRT